MTSTMRKSVAALPVSLGAIAAVAVAQPAGEWQIGPIIRGRHYSVGMPLTPNPERRGWSFEFPYPDERAGHVHYVTFRHGPLAGASRIVMRYRIDAAPGARFVPRAYPSYPATVSLYFQRAGDSWSGKRHPFHRWYAPRHTMRELAPGEYEVSVSLSDPEWASIYQPATASPESFRAALAETDRVGFVFGSDGGRGHGVFATAPARFTLISFRVL